jgi:translation initiation factor IF-1
MTHLHFWLRVEGDVTAEYFRPRPMAQLDDGRIVKYHVSGSDRAVVEEILKGGMFKWRYLGQGTIYTVDGTAQYAHVPTKARRANR